MAYAIPCPHCKQRPVEGVRDAWFIYGFLILSWHGSRSHVGCNACTRNRVGLNLLLVSLFGWWCFPWGLGTPIVMIQNLVSLLSPPNEAALTGMLRAKGIDPDDLRAGSGGRTAGDQRLVDGVLVTLHGMVWADGSADPREIEVGAAVAAKMLGRLVTADEVTAVLAKAECTIEANPKQLPDDAKPILMKAACLVAKADGVVEPEEVEALREIGRRLGLKDDVIEKFVASLGAPAAPKADDADLRAIAASVLGVEPDAPPAEIRAAYQAQMMAAQGETAEVVAAQTEKLKFAYETLLGADAMAA